MLPTSRREDSKRLKNCPKSQRAEPSVNADLCYIKFDTVNLLHQRIPTFSVHGTLSVSITFFMMSLRENKKQKTKNNASSVDIL